MNNADKQLDRAISRFLDGDESGEETKGYRASLGVLKTLVQIPERDAQRVRLAREKYLAEAAGLKPSVSPRRNSRLNGWMSIFRKERSPMFAIARIITIAAILLGGTTGTAFAAQESLPDQALYPLKTLIEDLRLELTADPQAEFDLLMGFIEERFSEIQMMAQNGDPVGEVVQLRLQKQLQSAFQNAAELDDPALLQAMERVREQSRLQLNVLNTLQSGIGNGPQGNLEVAEQAIIRSRIQAEGALEDPTTLRTRYGAQRNEAAPDQPEIVPPGGEQGGPHDGSGSSGYGEKNEGSNGPQRNGQTK